jgi:pimeloyl-ACP methyl ester carboxylesterase
MAGTMTSDAHALFIHGLWMPGPESHWFRRRLSAETGIAASVFTYRTTVEPLEAVIERLHDTISGLAAPQVHLIGHSLGGVVLLKLFDSLRLSSLPPGRVVLLGAPVCGSCAARRFQSMGLGRLMLGGRVADELLPERVPVWRAARQLGVIAGTRPLGLGRLFARFDEPNDGTVALRETEIAGASDRIVLPVSHMGMLMSSRVARETGHFLTNARFGL